MEPATKKHTPPSKEIDQDVMEDDIPRPWDDVSVMEDDIPTPGGPTDAKKARDRKRYETKKSLLEMGYTLLESQGRSMQLHAAKLLLQHYQHVASTQPSILLNDGNAAQIPVTCSNDTLEEAVLQTATDMLLEAAQPTTSFYFKQRGAPSPKLRASNFTFVYQKDDLFGQIPNATSFSTAFLICVVYLNDGARGTEVWPEQRLGGLLRCARIPNDREFLRKMYGGAVAMSSEDLLSTMMPVKQNMDFGDVLLLSPAALFREPSSIDARLCFTFVIEPEGVEACYSTHGVQLITDLAMRCHGFNSHEFMACHDTWLNHGFPLTYDADVDVHVREGHRRWKEWIKNGKNGKPDFFSKEERDAVASVYATCFE